MAGDGFAGLWLVLAAQAASPETQAVLPDAPSAPSEAGPQAIAVPPASAAAPITAATGTSVEIEIVEGVNSKTATQGQRFAIQLAAPLLDASGRAILPAGTQGEGEVIHARKAGFAGKAGELILAARFIRCGPIDVALGRFKFVGTGADRSGSVGAANAAAAGASVVAPVAVVAPLVVFMIKGGEIDIPAGARGTARLKADVHTTEEAVAACGAAVEVKGE